MEKRIELEKRARKPSQITELNLDNCRSTSIVGLTDEYTALESLSLINVGLTTLKGFPKLPNLKKLELSENRISNGLNYLITSPKLQYLNLSGNNIKDLETLKPLEELKHLANLDLIYNEVTQVENYREKIFAMIPSLKLLNYFDCNDVECAEDDDDYEDNISNSSDEVVSDMGEEEEYDEASLGDGAEDDEDDESEDEDNGDVSLAEVYNDDLEEDNSEWGAGSSDEEDDDDDESEEENDADGKKAETASAAADGKADAKVEKKESADAADGATEEAQARGKKRKHDG